MSNVPSPGLRGQSTARSIFRVVGPILLLAAVLLIGSAIYTFLSAMNSDSMDPETGAFARFIIGGVCMVAGGALTTLGYMGVAARYAAGEGAPVLKDTASYLSDGQGILGVGRTVDDPESKFCTSCGNPAPEAANFCESCGHAYA